MIEPNQYPPKSCLSALLFFCTPLGHSHEVIRTCFAFFFLIFIYLVTLDLGYGTWDLRSLLQHVGSLVVACKSLDLVSQPGTEPRPPALGAWSLSQWTTRDLPCFAFLIAALLSCNSYTIQFTYLKCTIRWFLEY